MAIDKECPVCSADLWNYDVCAYGKTWCGPCWENFRVILARRVKEKNPDKWRSYLLGDTLSEMFGKKEGKKIYFESLLQARQGGTQ